MSHDALHERGQALEDQFFRERDRKLLEEMKQRMQSEQDRTGLTSATGIKDPAVIDHLLSQGVRAESLASVGLIPLVMVAWADGSLDPRERDAILRAAEQSDIRPGQSSFQLLEAWLHEPPAHTLLEAWKEYVQCLKGTLDATAYNQLKTTVLSRAREVASAAGGFLGLGSISAEERRVLDELEQAFQ